MLGSNGRRTRREARSSSVRANRTGSLERRMRPGGSPSHKMSDAASARRKNGKVADTSVNARAPSGSGPRPRVLARRSRIRRPEPEIKIGQFSGLENRAAARPEGPSRQVPPVSPVGTTVCPPPVALGTVLTASMQAPLGGVLTPPSLPDAFARPCIRLTERSSPSQLESNDDSRHV